MTHLTKEEMVRLTGAHVEQWDSYEHAAQTASLARRESRTVAL